MLLAVQGYDAHPIRVDLEHDRTLGRADMDFMPDIDLEDFDAFERGVSRQHAVLRRQKDTVVLIDLNSANSTFLNGQRLVADQPRILRDGDEIRLGQLVLRVAFEDGFEP
jgi:pSer/pThr/pTyr-binding forkhead associated (FHA) protein